MKSILVDIVLSFHKNNDYIFQCLESIMWQTYQNFNVHIIDDNSQSNHLEKIKNIYKDDKRFNFYQNESNIGFYQSVNKYFKNFKGELFFIFDSDDISLPNRIEKTLEYYNKEKFDLFSAPTMNFVEEGEDDEKFQNAEEIINHIKNQSILEYINKPVHPYLDENDNIISSFINPSCCIRSEFFNEINGYSIFFAGGDRDFAYKSFYYGGKFVSSQKDEPLVLYRFHPEQITRCKNYGMSSLNRANIHKQMKNNEYQIYKSRNKDLIKKVGALNRN